ncbi:hypothetical protein Ae201684P_019184 [Aphanomyces euteiches]|uniref:Peptidase S1 domain-containing protein n=1 Tax=Aphanomyces euteiches TaxID=100861 RepID=A0A6G0WDR8_9STRA|nr:hypothetical protein Ae201684_016035 [Aphanomyces euteiches]KAH9078081.1 hypothetical protein Ae201684P_019184 [Aphanomyces euteiches]KAH9133548.1 hypothetical protein AeRB84_020387 [Aphanomyces euteiches]
MLALLVWSLAVSLGVKAMDDGHTVSMPSSAPLVQLSKFNEGPHICTGVLIAPNVVLTAAVCADASKTATIRSKEDVEHLEIASGRAHRTVSDDMATQYDVAVVLLRQKSKQPPAKLSFDTLSIGKQVLTYGLSQAFFDGATSQVREMNGIVMSPSDCNPVPGAAIDSAICISGPLSCIGDFGSPVMAVVDGQHVVVGLSTWSRQSPTCGTFLARYTRLSTMRDFIEPYLVPPPTETTPTPTPTSSQCPVYRPSL